MRIFLAVGALVIICIVGLLMFPTTRPNPVRYGIFNGTVAVRLQITVLKNAFLNFAAEQHLQTLSSGFLSDFLQDKETGEFLDSKNGVHLSDGQLIDGNGISYRLDVLRPSRLKITASDGQNEIVDLPKQTSQGANN